MENLRRESSILLQTFRFLVDNSFLDDAGEAASSARKNGGGGTTSGLLTAKEAAACLGYEDVTQNFWIG